MKKEFWMEKNWGGSADKATSKQITEAFEQIRDMDDPLAAFWIGCHDLEYVLKISKNRELVLIYGDNQDLDIKKSMSHWTQCMSHADLFLSGEFLQLLQQMYSPDHTEETSTFNPS
ncbi:hypothetical protein [Flavobacterium sp. HJSW_4]|uniref:hypothetical protein n=1 Tax=Flavobacterium sp. HJSW_4 TaxID=3344660 RepID=UPI0035F41DD0